MEDRDTRSVQQSSRVVSESVQQSVYPPGPETEDKHPQSGSVGNFLTGHATLVDNLAVLA